MSSLPNLILLHGWGLNHCVWSPVAAELEAYFTVHTLDLPGFGAEPGIDDYSLDGVAGWLLARTPPRAVWVGWSLGALLAMRVAMLAPQRVTRLILVGATPRFVQQPDWNCGMPAGQLQQFCDDLAQDYAGTLTRFLLLQSGDLRRSRGLARRIAELVAQCGDASREALRAGLALLLDTDLRTELHRVQASTEVIHGDLDRLAPPAAGEFLARHIPDAQFTRLPAGHALFLSHPREFVRQVAMLP